MTHPTIANPLLQPWTAPHGLPPFAEVRPEHFAPAFAQAMREHLAEIDAIAAQVEPPSVDNTLVAFDRDGARIDGGRDHATCTKGYSRASTRCMRVATNSGWSANRAACSSACTSTSCAPVPG